MSIREITEGEQIVGLDETPIFTLTTTNWGSTPTSVTVTSAKYDSSADTYTDNTSAVFASGSVSIAGDVITLKPMSPQAVGDIYYIEIQFTSASSVWEAFAWVRVER